MQTAISVLTVTLSGVLTVITYAYLRASKVMAAANARSAEAAAATAASASAQVSAARESVVEMREQRMAMARPFLVLASPPKKVTTSDGRGRITLRLENVGLGPAVAPSTSLRDAQGDWRSSGTSIPAVIVGAVWELDFQATRHGKGSASGAPASWLHRFSLSTAASDIYGRRIFVEQQFEMNGDEPVARTVGAPTLNSIAVQGCEKDEILRRRVPGVAGPGTASSLGEEDQQ